MLRCGEGPKGLKMGLAAHWGSTLGARGSIQVDVAHRSEQHFLSTLGHKDSFRSSDFVKHKPWNKQRKSVRGLKAQPLTKYIRNECLERRQGKQCAEIQRPAFVVT